MNSAGLVASPWRALWRLPDQTARDEHRMRDTSYRLILFAAIGGCLIQIYFILQMTSPSYRILKWVMQLYRVVYYIPTFVFAHRLRSYQKNIAKDQSSYYLSIPTLANISLLCTVVALCFSLITRTIVGQCVGNESMQACNPDADYNSLPQDGVLAMLLVVLVSQVLVRCYHVWVLLVAWLSCTISVIFCIAFLTASRSHNTLFFCFIMGFIMYEYERHIMVSYVALRNTEHFVRTQMRAENELQLAEMRSVEMRHLLGNVAHDLKTPMQSFVVELELLDGLLNRSDSCASPDGLVAMREAVKRLTDTNSFMFMIVNRAIDYVRSSANISLCPQLTRIDLVSCIEWTLEMMRSSTCVSLIMDPLPSNVSRHIVSDKQWLSENILCLVSNAAKFTPAGEVRVKCELLTKGRSPPMLYFEVLDTGIGMPKMNYEETFQPYRQTTRVTGGTGLGLYSLRNRVTALGGECGASNRSDGTAGARVWFTMPYHIDVQLQEEENHKPCVEMASLSNETRTCLNTIDITLGDVPHSPRMSLLVVDDSMMIRKSINRILVGAGMSVDLAENGQIAVEMLEQKKYDLVLMDLQMPVLDGLEATKRIREKEKHCSENNGNLGKDRQIIIGVSAYTDGSQSSDAIAAGMDGFMEKPFTVKRFFEMCSEIAALRNRVETL